MACGDYGGDMLDALAEGAIRDFITCGYSADAAFGSVGAFALYCFGILAIGGYYQTGDPVLIAVVAILIGSPILAQMAGVGVGFLVVILLAVLGVGPVIILRRLGRL